VTDDGDRVGRLRIGELSRRSGVSPERLRAWELRYDLLAPTRTTGGFRLYGEQDEARVRRMLGFLSNGIAAAEAARLAIAGRTEPAATGDDDLQRALDGFDDAAAHAALDRVFLTYGAATAMRSVLLPYLRELGERWANGSATVAQEHFATALLRGRLLGLGRGWGTGAGPRALLACVPGDPHDLGLICFGVALREHGWRITLLGADTPVQTLGETAAGLAPELVVVASSSCTLLDACSAELAEVASRLPVALAGNGVDAAAARAIGARLLEGDPVSAAADLASASVEV
jgi:DNA-binding transcriptional MerR regulator